MTSPPRSRNDRPLYRLQVENSRTNSLEELLVTPDHPFHVPGRGFVDAITLKPGDILASRSEATRGFLLVRSLALEKDRARTHNLTVAEGHTFFVGQSSLWVHNSGLDCASCAGGSCQIHVKVQQPAGLLSTRLSKAVRIYADEVQEATGYNLSRDQINRLKTELQQIDYSKPLSAADYKAQKSAFSNNKDRMIAEWENNTGQKWPTYGDPAPNGRVPGGPWDAHELIAKKNGGPLEWWNITPARFPDIHQKVIHGKDSAFNKLMREFGGKDDYKRI